MLGFRRLYLPVLVSTLAVGPAFAETLAFATLPPGAIMNVQSQVIAKTVQKSTDLRLRVIPYRGQAAQMAAVNKRQAELAIVNATMFAAAIGGQDEFKGRPQSNVQIAYRLMGFAVGFAVRADSEFKTVADLKGARLPAGWKAFPDGHFLSLGNLATAGLTYDDVVKVPVSNVIRNADDFKVGKTDAFLFAVGAPKVSEVDSSVGGIRFLPINTSPEAIARMRGIRPDYYVLTMRPAKPLAGIVAPTPLLAFDVLIGIGTHVSEDTAYKFVKAAHRGKAEMMKGHPSFRAFVPKLMAKQFSAGNYHPGAVKFYKEAGIWPSQ